MFTRRSAVGKNLIAAIVVIVVVGVAAVAVLSRGSGNSPSSTTTTSSSSTVPTVSSSISSSSAAAGLDITNMFLQVQGQFQPPSLNTTTIGTNVTTYTGQVNDIFTVTVDIAYTNCQGDSCPSQVSVVIACPSPPQVGQSLSCPGEAPSSNGFAVEEVDGGNGPPVMSTPTGTSSENFVFGVTLQGPSTPYDGTLTIIAQTS